MAARRGLKTRRRNLLTRLPVGLLLPVLVSGCGTLSVIQNFEPVGACADLVERAYPDASFDITDRQSAASGMSVTKVTIKAERTDTKGSPAMSRTLAAVCKYDHNVLVDFHWTQGPFK